MHYVLGVSVGKDFKVHTVKSLALVSMAMGGHCTLQLLHVMMLV